MSEIFTEAGLSDVTDTRSARRQLRRCQSHPNQAKKKHNVVDIAKLTRRLSQQRFEFSPKPNVVASVWQGFEKVDKDALDRKAEYSCKRTPLTQSGRIRTVQSACGRRSKNDLPRRPASMLGYLQNDNASVSSGPNTAMSVREFSHVKIRLSPAPSICGRSEISDTGTIFSSCARDSVFSDKTFGTSYLSERSFNRKISTSSAVSVGSSVDTEFMPRRHRRRSMHSRHRQSLAARPYQMIRELENETEEQRAKRKEMTRKKLFNLLQLVRWVVRLATRMKLVSMGRVERNLVSELHYYRMNGTRADKGVSLVFDRSKFSAKYQEQLPTHIQMIACKPPEIRTDDDIHKLMTVMNRIKSFEEKYTTEMKEKICRAVRYCFCERDRVVLREGHVGHCFYFLYSGCCAVQRMHTDPDTNTAKLMHENTIEKGACFGELALLGDGCRTATVICCTQTELFQLDKGSFMQICPGVFEKELDTKLDITKDQDLFTRFIPAKLTRMLCFQSQLVEYPIGRVIEKDWCRSANVYFVTKGRILLYHEDLRSAKKRVGRKVRRITVNGNMNKPLPWPADLIKNKNNRFAAIGMLQKGDHSDLRVLKEKLGKNMSSVIMLSEGATVLKIPISTFQMTIPIPIVDHYFRDTTDQHLELPSVEFICRRILDNLNWKGYKSKIVTSLKQEQHGAAMAAIPSTKKGSSGWSMWPGFVSARKDGKKHDDGRKEETLQVAAVSSTLHGNEESDHAQLDVFAENEETTETEPLFPDAHSCDDHERTTEVMSDVNRDSFTSVESYKCANIIPDNADINADDTADNAESLAGSCGNLTNSTESLSDSQDSPRSENSGSIIACDSIITEVGRANTECNGMVAFESRYSRVAANILEDLDSLTGYRSLTDSSKRSKTRNSCDWGFAGDNKWVGGKGSLGNQGSGGLNSVLEDEGSVDELWDERNDSYSPRSPDFSSKRPKSVSWSGV